VIATDFATWLTAAGTFLSAIAAGAAVWVAIVQPRVHRPKLSIPEPKRNRELVLADNTPGQPGKVPSAWVRLAVEADPKREAAEEVEITILDVRELRSRDGYPPSKSDPMLSGLSLSLASSGGQSVANIPAGGFRIFDLASAWFEPAETAPLKIEVAWIARPTDQRNELKWGEVEIDLAVTAKNAADRRYRVRIAYDGKWKPDPWEHLRVTSLEPLAS
jgi:hypothetical protein